MENLTIEKTNENMNNVSYEKNILFYYMRKNINNFVVRH